MKGVVNETFEIQEKKVQISNGPTVPENRMKEKSGITLTSKKSYLIIGISLVGVLAVVGVVVGTTVPKSGSEDVTPHETNSLLGRSHEDSILDQQSVMGIVQNEDVHRTKIEKLKRLDKIARKNALKKPLKKAKINSKAGEICETAECAMSAATLISSIDESADPCDDFYQFACGGWYAANPIGNQSLGTFFDAADLVSQRLDLLLNEDSVPSDPQPVRDARTHYQTCLDTDTMDSLGIAPLWAQLNSVEQSGWPLVMDSWDSSKFMLEQALVFIEKLEVNPMIAVGLSSDFLNTSYNILYMIEGGLGTSSNYLLNPDESQEQLGYYKTYISSSAKLIRDGIGSSVTDESIDQDVEDLVNFESALAKTMQFIPTDLREVLQKMDVAGLQSLTDSGVPGQFNWLAYFRILFSATDVVINSDEPIYIAGEPFFPAFSTLLSQTDPRILANYVGWWWVMTTGDATTYAMRNVTLQYRNSLSGATSLYSSRASHCQAQTQYNLGMPTSRLYVDEYFDEATRTQIFLLVELIREAYNTLLEANTWMSPEDLVSSQTKLAAIVERVAYPDWIMNNAELNLAYNGLQIVSGEQYDNLIRMADYFNYWTLETFRAEPAIGWPLPPTVVNAFYDPLSNSITILAAILQPPFFTLNSLAAMNYGAIGMVIGHEMTHGFDNTGRHFDENGNYANWWGQTSIDNFKTRSQCFVDQYDQYYPPELQGTQYSNMSVDGQQTLGENIADNGGIREAFVAYTSYVAQYGMEPLLPGLEDYSPDQLFFMGYANVWCEHKTVNDLVRQLNTDPHSPGRFRVIGPLSNDDDFRTVWGCPAGAAMNRGNESCLLW